MWELTEVTHGRKSCDNFELESDVIPEIITNLQEEFDIEYGYNGGVTPAFAGFDFTINGEQITIGWDNWSGVFIMSQEETGDRIVMAIYEYLCENRLEKENEQMDLDSLLNDTLDELKICWIIKK